MPKSNPFPARHRRTLRLLFLALLLPAVLLGVVLRAAGQEPASGAADHPQPAENVYGTFLPAEMSYQGQLVDDNGLPQVGSYSMQFGVYGPPPTYTLRYTETQTVATDPEGLFNVMIGAVQPGLDGALGGGDAWLQVQLDGEVLAPLQPIGTVAYAQYAQRLVGGTGADSAIGGGLDNEASGTRSTVSGGNQNLALGSYAVVAGGNVNVATEEGATVSGGGVNEATAIGATVGGGFFNRANGPGSTVGGGGYNGTTPSGNFALAASSTVAGGYNNTATDDYTTVGGGRNNQAGDGSFNSVNARFATVSGGDANEATDDYATIGGGQSNRAEGVSATVGGGKENVAGGDFATVPGGVRNVASGDVSFAAGLDAFAVHDRTFVWNGSSEDFSSTDFGQFLIGAPRGVGIGTNAPESDLHVAGNENGNATDLAAHVATIENIATGTSPDVLALVTGAANPGGSVNYVTFFDSSGAIAAIEGNGAGGVAYVTSGADFAEYLPLSRALRAAPAPGTVLGLTGSGLTLDTGAAQRVLVVSTAAGFVGNAAKAQGREDAALVAFLGQVPVRVRGLVAAGDVLIASGLGDGTAIAIAPDQLTPAMATQIVGQALQSNHVGGVTLINALVGQPTDAFWAAALSATEARLSELEARLAELEAAVQTLLEVDDE